MPDTFFPACLAVLELDGVASKEIQPLGGGMLAWSQMRLLITLAVATLIVMEPVSWVVAPIHGTCIVNPENYAAYYPDYDDCPTFHVFLIVMVVRIFEHFGDPNWVIADFTVVLAVSTVCLWVVTWKAGVRQSRDMTASLNAAMESSQVARQANELAEKHFALEKRPWVSPVDISLGGKPIKVEKGWLIKIAYRLKNTGNTPAFSVMTHYRATPWKTGVNTSVIQRELAAFARTIPFGTIIFPGQPDIPQADNCILGILRYRCPPKGRARQYSNHDICLHKL